MTIQKKTILENAPVVSYEDDDYYAVERKRIAEEAQKARRIHEEDVQTHITAMIPYYEDADSECRRCLLSLNNILIHRFSEAGMVYWGIFRHAPSEIREYSDLFWEDLVPNDVERIVVYLNDKNEEAKNMVDIGFDADGEEDSDFRGDDKDEEDESDSDEDREKDE